MRGGHPQLRCSPWRFRLFLEVAWVPSSMNPTPSEGVSKEEGINFVGLSGGADSTLKEVRNAWFLDGARAGTD